MTMFVDIFEPEEIRDLCMQSVEVFQMELNNQGKADYMWVCADGHFAQVERKQWGEVLGGMDRVEDQLRREQAGADETYLLIEGVAEPTALGMVVYKKAKDKPYWYAWHHYGSRTSPDAGLYGRVCAWLWGLDKAGITVVRTPHQAGTAVWLVAAYKQGQKLEHRTLDRYIRVRRYTKERDPRVLTLMGIVGVSLGEVKAKALVGRFGSIYNMVNSDPWELMKVDGIGEVLAVRLLRSLGREDV